jgi:hypothetical protein
MTMPAGAACRATRPALRGRGLSAAGRPGRRGVDRIGPKPAQMRAPFSGTVDARGRRDGSPPLGGGFLFFVVSARRREPV